MVGLVFFSVSFVILAGIMANKRNRSTAGWVILSLVVSPIITILFLLALGKKEKEDIPGVWVEEKQGSDVWVEEKQISNVVGNRIGLIVAICIAFGLFSMALNGFIR